MTVADPLETPQWKRSYAFCGECWGQKVVWVKGNVGYCLDCRPEWHPVLEPLDNRPEHNDGTGASG